MGGILVNVFEKDVQSKRNDAIDSGMGFAFSFVFFVLIFTIGTVIKLVG